MSGVHLLAGYATPFGKHHTTSYKELFRAALVGVLEDARLADGTDIEMGWFANATMHLEGQHGSRGQVLSIPLVREGLLPARMPFVNVENACAGGSSAFLGAALAIGAGQADLALAIGVEKLYDPDGQGRLHAFTGALDVFDPHEWQNYYAAAGRELVFGPDRSPFMDTYAAQASYHMQRWGTTAWQLAEAAAIAHTYAVDNPRAQYRFGATAESVLADRMVSEPLTRAMCAPLGDGAAAVLVCSDSFLAAQPREVAARAVTVRGLGMAGGAYRGLDEPGLASVAAAKAYRRTGLTPADIDVAEVHDATSFGQIYQAEMLGFCDAGEGGKLIESGETRLRGRIPLNTSGGLVAKGHPIGATGCSMLYELMEQLRGEAGARQVEGARFGLAENGGGVIGFDEAVAVVTILEGRQP